MELKETLVFIISSAAAFIGLFGWSHRNLRKEMDTLEDKITERPTKTEVRQLIQDKMDVVETNIENIKTDIEELKSYQRDNNHTLVSILNICNSIKDNNGE